MYTPNRIRMQQESLRRGSLWLNIELLAVPCGYLGMGERAPNMPIQHLFAHPFQPITRVVIVGAIQCGALDPERIRYPLHSRAIVASLLDMALDCVMAGRTVDPRRGDDELIFAGHQTCLHVRLLTIVNTVFLEMPNSAASSFNDTTLGLYLFLMQRTAESFSLAFPFLVPWHTGDKFPSCSAILRGYLAMRSLR